jgi:hypothetical protein
MNLPTVSKRLNVKIINKLYHAPLFSTSFIKIIFVSNDIPGKTTKVTRKTKNRESKNCQDCMKLILSMNKNVLNV